MADADFLKALRDWVPTITGVSALLGDRVFGIELPESEAANDARANVVINYAGGGANRPGARDTAHVSSVRLDWFFYGETPYQADLLRRTVHAGLRDAYRVVQDNVLLNSFTLDSGPRTFRDPDNNWPVSVETWNLLGATTLTT